QVEGEAGGVEPGTIDPVTGQSTGAAHLASNVRSWRNVDFGAFVQDDWKVTPRFTLNLGLRYDLFTRHTEKYGHVTQFVLPSTGANLTERLRNINCFVDISDAAGFDGQPCTAGFEGITGQLAWVDHNNVGQGPAGASFNAFQGNIMGWNPYNSNAAFLTGVLLPNFRDPYVYGSHLTVEHQFGGGAVLKGSWVGTFGHKLYRSEDINRQ